MTATPREVERWSWNLVIVVDGDAPVAGWKRLVAAGATVVAADGGARHARTEGVEVTDVVGDLDSLRRDEIDDLVAAGARLHRFDPAKDFTDFELAAQLIAAAPSSRGADVLVVGGAGGRLDHQLGNLAVLGGPALAQCQVTALLGDTVVRVASPDHPVTIESTSDDQSTGRIVSLVPAGGTARGVSTHGLRYPLDHEDLDALATRGISNVVVDPPASVTVTEGRLLVIEPGAVQRLVRPPTGATP